MSQVATEFDRLESVFKRLGRDLNRQPPATEAQIESIARITGVELDTELKDLWRISNGSGNAMWFAEGDDFDFTPYYFLSIECVLENWCFFAPYDASVYEGWYDNEEWGERDERIQRHYLRHKDWVSFGEFNNGSHLLLFDADPTRQGTHGQIINYIHDPDGICWRAKSFLDFLTTSNSTLEEWLDTPDALRDKLWLWD